MKPHLIFYFLIIIFSFQIKAQGLEQQFIEGSYHSIIEKASKIKVNNNFNDLFYLARSYSKLNKQRDYHSTIKLIKKHQKPSEKIAYHTLLSYYYQQMMFIDSCMNHADIALKKLRKSTCKDSLIISETYRQYANAMRNGSQYHEVIKNAGKSYQSFVLRNEFLKSYLDTALMFAPSDDQKGDIYHTIGTMLSDASYQYTINKDERFMSFGKESIKYLRKGIQHEKSSADIAWRYAIIGLNQYYIKEYAAAEKSYLTGLEFTKVNGKVIFPYQFVIISDWLGMNYEMIFKLTQDQDNLKKANEVYNNSTAIWDLTLKNEQFNDSYHNSAHSRLIKNHLDLFEASKDSTHLQQAFKFLEQSKYPDLYNENVSIKSIQNKLKNGQAFISYGSLSRPWRHIAFVFTKDNFYVLTSKGKLMVKEPAVFDSLYQFNNLQNFKRQSNTYYKVYFEMVDTLLKSKNINQIIISNSDNMSLLNLDILISDTVGEKWKDLNYIFHRYNISYALSAGSFLNQKKVKNKQHSFGLSLGTYIEEANLRFSHQLGEKLSHKYAVKDQSIGDNINQNDISLLLSHGVGSYHLANATVKLNAKETVSANYIEQMQLDNELVIFSACNTNASQRYFSNGAIGSFNKAFIKAGSKAIVTTSWAIDDKANSFIIDKLIENLAAGEGKNTALWNAKKEYWKSNTADEAFNPLYWGPYILTGNIQSLNIKTTVRNKTFNTYWLLILLLIPVAIFFKRRFF